MIFKKRNSGNSKLDSVILLEFLMLIFDKMLGKFIPMRFIMFVLVGFFGIFVHLLCLIILVKLLNVEFIYSQSIATLIAMINNFFLNNIFTYRDKRITGIRNLIKGVVSFCTACSIGAMVNVVTAEFLHSKGIYWIIAGALGCIIGSIWNYAITSCFTWERKKTPQPVS